MTAFHRLTPLLQSQMNNGQIAHAYIFRGQDSQFQAQTLAALLNCPDAADNQPCGICPVCRNILAGTYPDYHLIEPDKGSHRIEDMKTLSTRAGLAALNGGWKVFIILQAEKLTDEAANNLLKLLEEPPERTVFILLCDQPEQLLPTVLSRCQIFVLDRQTNTPLDAVDSQTIAEAADLLEGFAQMSIYEVLIRARDREKREDQRAFLFALLHVLHEAAIGQRQLTMPYAYLLRSETMVESSLELIENNINQKLLMDVVYLRLWQNSQY
jgi:DNA polymerase-3 subunit delta'